MNAMRFFKSKIFLAAAGCLLAAFWFFNRNNGFTAFAEVKRGEVVKNILVAGKVVSAEAVSLGFERSGRLAGSFVKVGDRVVPGEALVRLESSAEYASVLEAEAALKEKQAALDALLKGATAEEVAVSETKLQNARVVFLNFQEAVKNEIRAAYTVADDAVRNKADQLFSNARSDRPIYNYLLSDFELKRRLESRRRALEERLISLSASLSVLDFSTLSETAEATRVVLSEANIFFDDLVLALAELSPRGNLSQTVIDGWKKDVASARSGINSALISLAAAEKNLKNSEAEVALKRDELALLKAPPTPEEVARAKALRDSAAAALLKAKVALENSIIRSPISGLVVWQDKKAGEFVSAGERVISLMNTNRFEIEANVPEVEISSVAIGNQVRIVFDALPAEEFSGSVFSIDPAEVLLEGVPTYRVKISLDSADERVRAGLTANLAIESVKKVGVLVLPARFVKKDTNGFFVNLIADKGKTAVRKPIIPGLRGTNGLVEIMGGLEEGDKVAD